jgi:Flp pilus assembly protein TadD
VNFPLPGTPSLDEILQRGLRDHHAGRLQQAELAYTQVLAIEPNHVHALHLLGVIAHQAGRDHLAVDYIGRAIAADPGIAEAHNNLGLALQGLGRLTEAEASFREALRLKPNADAYSNLGNVLCVTDRLAEAEAIYRESLRLEPESASTHNNLGNTLWNLHRPVEAEASYREALRLCPAYPEAHNNLAITLNYTGRSAAAVASCHEAIRLQPDFAEAHAFLGTALLDLGRPDEAEASYRTALRLRPDFPEAHLVLAILHLLRGRFAEGWDEYEWRWRCRSFDLRPFTAPLWKGEDIGGRVILLHAEQGLGDTLQFCRYIPLIAPDARVILEVQAPLVPLLAQLPGVASIIAVGDDLPSFDLHCPLMSLPRAFGTTLDTVPGVTPYLTADAQRVAHWQARLANLRGLRVGLVWAGERKRTPESAAIDRRRSMTFGTLGPLAEVSGVNFISLQKDSPAPQDARPPDGMLLHDFTDELDDFADTAALVACLDLVISVDTAVAHLAGALNKPVWLLNRFDTCWRWLRDRDDSPWYPTMRQFRQPSPGDWDSVIGATRNALRRLVASKRDPLC